MSLCGHEWEDCECLDKELILEKGNSHNIGDIEMLIQLSEKAAYDMAAVPDSRSLDKLQRANLAAQILKVTNRLKRQHGLV